jgi:hypothetical protein
VGLMAKRASGSRASKPKADRTKKSVRARLERERASVAATRVETISAEAAHEATKAKSTIDPSAFNVVLEDHVAEPGRTASPAERAQHAEDAAELADFALDALRRFITAHDEEEKPFLRVVGGIIYKLTEEAGKASCTVTPIAVVLLLFLPEHLDPEHRQSGTTRHAINVTEPNLQGLLYDRLQKLTSPKWLQMLEKMAEGRGFRLTKIGKIIFDTWPEDLTFDPCNADLWTKKRPSTRVVSISPTPRSKR